MYCSVISDEYRYAAAVIPFGQQVALIQFTPDPIIFQVGPISIGWYGVGYVIGLAVLLLIAQYETARRGYNPNHVWNALLLVGALALIGGRLYHVIDQWGPIYSSDPLRAILPPYAGLGLYGGVAGAVLGLVIYTRWKKIPLPISLDVVVAGALFAQGIARWGNFFNQELYGPPTDLPWGIAIDCAHRVAEWPCTLYPEATTGFHPLFFYESVLDILGGFVVLILSRRWLHKLQPGDLAAVWGIWYGATRTFLETFRAGWNWTFSGVPTAQIIGIALMLIGIIWIIYNHPRGKDPYPYLPPWTAEREYAETQLALAGATAGGGSLAMSGPTAGTDSDAAGDADDEDDDEEWEDADTDNDQIDDSHNEESEDF
jgi:phosphatidylglycerol:prolipoprotein diacylglycerol transferase